MRERGRERERRAKKAGHVAHVVILPPLPIPLAHKANDESWRSWRKQSSRQRRRQHQKSLWLVVVTTTATATATATTMAYKLLLLLLFSRCCYFCFCNCCCCDRLTTRLADILAARSQIEKKKNKMKESALNESERERAAAMKNQFRNVTTSMLALTLTAQPLCLFVCVFCVFLFFFLRSLTLLISCQMLHCLLMNCTINVTVHSNSHCNCKWMPLIYSWLNGVITVIIIILVLTSSYYSSLFFSPLFLWYVFGCVCVCVSLVFLSSNNNKKNIQQNAWNNCFNCHFYNFN